MSWASQSKYKYVASTNKNVNQASKYANSIIKSESAIIDPNLMNDYQTILKKLEF